MVAKYCSPFRTVQTSLLELILNTKHCFSVWKETTCKIHFLNHSGCIFEAMHIFVNHFQFKGLFKQFFQFWPNFSFRAYKDIYGASTSFVAVANWYCKVSTWMCCQELYPWVSGTERIHNIFISFKEGFKFFSSAYQSPLSTNDVPHKAVTALLPLLQDHANTPAMIHHAMLLMKKQAE